MSYQTQSNYRDGIHARIAFESMGVKYVQVRSGGTAEACDYCRPMHNSIIPLVALTPLYKHCKNEQGCCCHFEPTFDVD
jgi:hypothetical protein